ncbi:MAG: hypothetical protein NTV00_00175 [Methylococcales bacterium]|nr:hypothetical protein [Methylococcales bacterium]
MISTLLILSLIAAAYFLGRAQGQDKAYSDGHDTGFNLGTQIERAEHLFLEGLDHD